MNRILRVGVDVDTETDRFAVWKEGIGWVEFVLADLAAQIIAERDAEADAVLDEPGVAQALKEWVAERRIPSVELLARASAEHYEWDDSYNASRMGLAAKAEHHRLYCMVEGKRWHDAIVREYAIEQAIDEKP